MQLIHISIIKIIGVILGFITIVAVMKQKSSENQKLLVLTCSFACASVLIYTLEINLHTTEAILLAVKLGYVSKCYALVIFLLFIMSYYKIKFPKRMIKVLFIYLNIILIIILT